MAVDMSNVKQIMHNNKEVIKIEDHLGNIIWQKIADQRYIRLEYIEFDGTNYCVSAEHNANNRAYRLDYMQTGWSSNNLCYPFGIWTRTAPQNILLTRNEKRNTTTGFEVCRVGNTIFGQHPTETYLNNRMVAEMRWGTDTTVNYRLWYHDTSTYVENSSGTASGRTGTNTGDFFIGAINDGGEGSHTNANGLLVGRIYEIAIAGSNSFDDYAYAYVPCIRRSDGAIGFKQPHADFWPLRNKEDGSIVTDVTAHMGPVVEENWDGVTYTIEPSPEPTPVWHTLWSGSQNIRAYGGYQQSGSVIGNNVTLVNAANVLSNSVQVRITFNTYELTYPQTQGTHVTTWVPSPKVSSPWTKTLSSKTGYTYLLGGEAKLKADYSSTINQDAWVYLEYKLTNNQLSFHTYAAKNTNTTVGGRVNARIVITKIEAYY